MARVLGAAAPAAAAQEPAALDLLRSAHPPLRPRGPRTASSPSTGSASPRSACAPATASTTTTTSPGWRRSTSARAASSWSARSKPTDRRHRRPPAREPPVAAEMVRLRVRPDQQGRGYGAAIVTVLEERAVELGYRTLHGRHDGQTAGGLGAVPLLGLAGDQPQGHRRRPSPSTSRSTSPADRERRSRAQDGPAPAARTALRAAGLQGAPRG